MVRCVDCLLLSASWGTDGRPLARLVTALRAQPATDCGLRLRSTVPCRDGLLGFV